MQIVSYPLQAYKRHTFNSSPLESADTTSAEGNVHCPRALMKYKYKKKQLQYNCCAPRKLLILYCEDDIEYAGGRGGWNCRVHFVAIIVNLSSNYKLYKIRYTTFFDKILIVIIFTFYVF